MTDKPTEEAVLAFIAALAAMNLNAPNGVHVEQYKAKRLREIRNAARHVLNCQYDELEQVLAKMLGDRRIRYTPDGIMLGVEH